MPLDCHKYQHYLDEFELSEQEKHALIQQVWTILESFVDTAYGRHPHQQCGKRKQEADLQGSVESLESEDDRRFPHTRPIAYDTLTQKDPS